LRYSASRSRISGISVSATCARQTAEMATFVGLVAETVGIWRSHGDDPLERRGELSRWPRGRGGAVHPGQGREPQPAPRWPMPSRHEAIARRRFLQGTTLSIVGAAPATKGRDIRRCRTDVVWPASQAGHRQSREPVHLSRVSGASNREGVNDALSSLGFRLCRNHDRAGFGYPAMADETRVEVHTGLIGARATRKGRSGSPVARFHLAPGTFLGVEGSLDKLLASNAAVFGLTRAAGLPCRRWAKSMRWAVMRPSRSTAVRPTGTMVSGFSIRWGADLRQGRISPLHGVGERDHPGSQCDDRRVWRTTF
jgi:hypothetical protein